MARLVPGERAPSADAGLRPGRRSWSFARLRPPGARSEHGAGPIPAREYRADERAERARSAVIVLLAVAITAIAVPVFLIAIWLS